MTEPLSNQELAEIRDRVTTYWDQDSLNAYETLLAEVDRLRAHVAILVPALKEQAREQGILQDQIAALRPIVEAVADVPVYATDGERYWGCIFCDAWHKGGWSMEEEANGWPVRKFIEHTPDCPVTRARLALGLEAPQQTEDPR
jgi:hypothetical protein